MHAGELLQTSRAPKPEHSSLFSPEGEVRILRSVVLVATDLLAVLVADVFHCGAVGWAPIGDYDAWIAISFHCFS